MSNKYKFNDPAAVYFITFTVVDWIDLFTRNAYKDILEPRKSAITQCTRTRLAPVWIGLAFALASCLQVNAQNTKQDNTYKKWFVGSTLYLLGNFTKTHNPEYIQLNAGYRITPNDVVHFRFKRSVYDWPLGTPWGKIFDGTEDAYPGHARILAPTLGYQRFWWKGVYTSVYALNAFEKYMDENNKKIGNGYTLYLDFYLGYQFKFFKDRFFFEPAIGISYWPVRTNVPESFKAIEQKWPNYFIQPGFDFGFKF